MILLLLLTATLVSGETHIFNETKEVDLECPVKSDRVVWLRANKSLEETPGYKIKDNKLYFTISKTTLGMYQCKTPDHGDHDVEVFSRPIADGDLHQHKNAINDETFVFECKGYGYPTPVVEWKKDNVTLDYGLPGAENPRITVKNSTNMAYAILKIKKVVEEDAGLYTCEASNEFGTFVTELEVTVKDKYAALWPFLGICVEVAVLCAIILLIEKKRSKKEEKVVLVDENDKSPSDNKQADELRQRK